MNRIYQGKVTDVEALGKDADGKPQWQKLPKEKWQQALWQHHELFQDAVNYYTLALAALAEGLPPDNKTVLGWRDRVRDSWKQATRKAVKFDGPHARIAPLLGLDPATTDFADCAKRVLRNNGSTAEARAACLLALLEDANSRDLSQMGVQQVRALCSTVTKAGDAVTEAGQIAKRILTAKAIHAATSATFENVATTIDLGVFCKTPPTPDAAYHGKPAVKQLKDRFKKLHTSKKKKPAPYPHLKAHAADFEQAIDKALAERGDALTFPKVFKPARMFNAVVAFAYWPNETTWEVAKQATQSLLDKTAPQISRDAVAEARAGNQPLFDYFSNRTMAKLNPKTDAAWFEFDLAAFIEAIKSPHRFFQDTIKREQAVAQIKAKLAAMEGQGRAASGEEDALPGFEGDDRITLLRELVTDTLGYLAEADASTSPGGKIEYSIQERTVRGFAEVKRRWRDLVEKGKATEDALLQVLAEEQTEHRDDFGSATLYRELAKPKFHPIWRDAGTQPWHAEDPLRAWLEYRELGRELEDKERPIRFTPAHPVHSPRFFIFPKKKGGGRFGTVHEPGQLRVTAGIVAQTQRGWEPVPVRITYAAPRLRRDQLRDDVETDLESRPWLQPMMQALGLPEPDTTDFSNCRVTLQPVAPDDIQLTFPVDVSADKLTAAIGKATRWARQFNLYPDGDDFYNASLRWPHEKKPSKPPVPWHDALNEFSVLAADLGQRCAGAFARLEVRANDDFDGKPSRFIGETPGKKWRAVLVAAGMLRLPGEEQTVWRQGATGPNFHTELSGSRGRMARPHEADDTADLLRAFDCPEEALMPADWRTSLSFPEQNDKLLVAARRYQSRVARLHRWCWFLTDVKKRQTALEEIREAENMPASDDPQLAEKLRALLLQKQAALPALLVRLANRILPLRGRSWRWEIHPEKADCHLLTQNGAASPDVWIRGQRGLSMQRIEQIEELRRRFQSLNQIQRREIGGKPPIRRDDSIPDCCPDLLDKLDNIKEQRVNQTAHMILAEALGLRLAPPPPNKRQLRASHDVHGQYVKTREPVDFIVIEDLSRYRSSQGRAPRENSRLMKWCHRAVRDKLRELCEPFGIPVVETPAAYSSRFCSRSGVAGFRAVEVGPGCDREFPWVMLKDKVEDGRPTDEARWVQELICQVASLNQGRNGKPPRTLLAPLAGGPIFVPIVDKVIGADIQPAPAQADINAAINLGLRAIADPRLWSIHPRCRTQRQDDQMLTREKRKFGETGQPLAVHRADGVKPNDTRNPNFFADISSSLPAWESATLDGQRLLSGRCLWSEVKKQQWQRCAEINDRRIRKWEDNIPM